MRMRWRRDFSAEAALNDVENLVIRVYEATHYGIPINLPQSYLRRRFEVQ
jgi:hypothetical protein